MDLDPQTLFGLIVGAPLILMLGMGIFAAIAIYSLDRLVRQVEAEEEEASSAPARDQPEATSSSRQPVTSTPQLSAVSQMVTAEGALEMQPTMGLPHVKLGMWVFLASEIMFFTALIGAFLAFRVGGQFGAEELAVVGEALNVPLAALNTFLLIVSSFTVVMALEAVQEGKINRFVLFLLATLVLGSVFLSIQGVEWSELLNHGITPKNTLFGTVFFVMTGFHGAHVAVGILWLVVALLKAFRGDFSVENNMGIEMFGLYWHFVDIVWIVLFTMIYLLPYPG